MTDNDKIFKGIMDGLEEGLDFVRGDKTKGSVKRVKKYFRPVRIFTKDEIKAIRSALRLSQPAFSSLLGVNVDTLRSWELGRVQIPGPNSRLLEIFSQENAADLIEIFEVDQAKEA